MNTETLKTFVELSKCGNFTKTSKNLFLSQSTVSDRIKELESQLGQKLLNRGTPNVTLTSAGQAFLVYAKKMLELEREAIAEVNMMQRYSGLLHISATHNLFDNCVSDILQIYLDCFPDISLKINIAHSEEILPIMTNYDIAFVYTPYKSSLYLCDPFIEEDIILVTNSRNTEYENGITFNQISSLPLVNAQLSDSNSIWPFSYDRLCSVSINIFSKVHTFLTAEREHYCFLTRQSILKELESGYLIEIPVLDMELPKKQSYMIYKKNYKDNEFFKAFVDISKKQSQSAL